MEAFLADILGLLCFAALVFVRAITIGGEGSLRVFALCVNRQQNHQKKASSFIGINQPAAQRWHPSVVQSIGRDDDMSLV